MFPCICVCPCIYVYLCICVPLYLGGGMPGAHSRQKRALDLLQLELQKLLVASMGAGNQTPDLCKSSARSKLPNQICRLCLHLQRTHRQEFEVSQRKYARSADFIITQCIHMPNHHTLPYRYEQIYTNQNNSKEQFCFKGRFI